MKIPLQGRKWIYSGAYACFLAVALQAVVVLPLCTVPVFALQPQTQETASKLGERVYARANQVFERVAQNRYMHLHEDAMEQVQEINGQTCEASTDCSGFVSYVLATVAPRQYAVVCERSSRTYPQAKTYAYFFRSLSTVYPQAGWLQLRKFSDLRRGDFIAWAKPVDPMAQNKGNTGHVMIVIDASGSVVKANVKGEPVSYVNVSVIDSSSVYHFPPEILPPMAHQQHRDGVGKGNVRLVLDDSGKIIGYWEGTYSNEKQKEILGPTFTDMIGLARIIPEE